MFSIPLFWLAIALTLTIPIVLVASGRYVAVRLANRSGHVGGEAPALPLPTIKTQWLSWRKLLIFTIFGAGAMVALMRFVFGIGAVSNMSDSFPWGIWIGFDVMGGVALAAGAFVIAAIAHIFNRERFEPLVRPAILTGFLGYLLVVCGLVVDLGRPYNIWRPIVHWQHHSVMWEVGLCVFTYTIVLFIEFAPVILEKVNSYRGVTTRLPTVPLYRLLRRISMLFVILGVILSTLHQSSLGSLWVLVPGKLHPLWYSLYLPVFFWLSAIAVGLAMTIVESTLSAKAFGRGLELDLIADLARGASVVLLIYLCARFADLLLRGSLSMAFQSSVEATFFWIEITLGIVFPILIFSSRTLRQKPAALFIGAAMVVVFGIVMNRMNIALVGMWEFSGTQYLPSWMEVAVTLSLVTLGVFAFAMAAKYLPLFEPDAGQASEPQAS